MIIKVIPDYGEKYALKFADFFSQFVILNETLAVFISNDSIWIISSGFG